MKFSGVTILQGVEFSIFPINFEWALQQCSATALPVIKGQVVLQYTIYNNITLSANKAISCTDYSNSMTTTSYQLCHLCNNET